MATKQTHATFGSGCFWCTEAIFKDVRGVSRVTSGYCGGEKPNPTYEDVCTGATGHAEVVQLDFDPGQVTYEQLVELFFLTHDPTQRNRQGNDIGTQYRSIIFAHDQGQAATARAVIRRFEQEKLFDRPIITEVVPSAEFFPAESYHQDYFAKNPDQPYCTAIISPKVAKFRRRFAALLRSTA